MYKLSGKVIEASEASSGQSEPMVGQRLRELRQLAGLTQRELGIRIGVGQSKISNLERKSDLEISTLKSYVEALGATLKIGAAFSAKSGVAIRIADAFETDFENEDQFILPVFGDDEFRPQRDVVLSIKPQYSTKIIGGQKTVELRRRFPSKVPQGTKVYIYSTTPERALVGTADLEAVHKKSLSEIWSVHSKQACIDKADFDSYFSGLTAGFVLQLNNARPLRRTLALSELRDRFGFMPPQSFLYATPQLREALKYECAEVSN